MKHEQAFSNFLENKVNLNKSRVDVAEASIETMKNFLQSNDAFSELFIDAIPQGSFRQKTIIKPVSSDMDFDVDLLVELIAVEDWEPKDYLIKLSEEFKATDRYKDLVDTRGKERCVTIDYANDFHVDIVPSITVGGNCYIMNKATNQFEPTDGDGYAEWFARQNELTGNNHLTKVIRLLKYIRDDCGKFEIKSILLTTLLGNQVYSADKKEIQYPDIATSFITLISRLDDFLQVNVTMPIIFNPVLSTENFNRKWTAEKYSKFRDAIHEIAIASKDAYNQIDEGESFKKWQKVFGDSFVITADENDTKITEQESKAICLGDYSHRQMPTWPRNIQGTVEITKCHVRGRMNLEISSNAYPICNGCDLNYFAEVKNISGPYEVWWQVVNTGDHAREENCLRGNFEVPKDPANPLQQKESSGYTGKHWIQCFIVKSGYLIAESKPFFLNVVNKKRNSFKFRH